MIDSSLIPCHFSWDNLDFDYPTIIMLKDCP